MSEPFVGEIRMFAGNFNPRGWAFCDGQLLAVAQNDALFSLLGTIYGGDGRTTFALPDLRGRLAIGESQGPGLSNRNMGASGGAEQVLLSQAQTAHGHDLVASSNPGDQSHANGNVLANTGGPNSYVASGATTPLGQPTGNAGGSRPHSNIMPFLCINYIIALVGIYPSRN